MHALAFTFYRRQFRLVLVVWMAAATLAGRGLGAVSADAAKVDSVESRLAVLERQVIELASENKALRTRLGDASDKPAMVLVRPEGRETGLSLGGVMQVQGETGGAPDSRYTGINDRIQLRRMRVAFAGAFAESMVFKCEADFGNASISSRSGLSGQITDAFVGWTRFPLLNLRAGQFKTPFGYEQLVSDPKTLFIERSLSNDRLTVGRQIGAQASGGIGQSLLAYSVGVFNGCGTNVGGNDNAKFMTAGRLVATVFTGERANQAIAWTVAGNFFNTVDKGAFTGRRFGAGYDTQLSWGPGRIGAEWLRNDNHPIVGGPASAEGWNLFAAWNFDRRWQGVLRYDVYDAGTPRVDATTREWTYGFNYLLKGDDLKLSLNYQLGRPPAPAASAGRLLGRMQVVF